MSDILMGYKLLSFTEEDFGQDFEKVKGKDRPVKFAYCGNISLLKDVARNVAVIGVLKPTKNIIEREKQIVKVLVEKGFNIVSGLANGCDTVAHETCLDCGGKTIAFLPCTFENIYPKQNEVLAGKIVESGGLVITEYTEEPQNKFDRINRFVRRDRLQAMYSKAVVLIASYIKGNGDSGSRYAMQKAEEYGRLRYCMYNAQTDKGRDVFGLNEKLVEGGVPVLTKAAIERLKS